MTALRAYQLAGKTFLKDAINSAALNSYIMHAFLALWILEGQKYTVYIFYCTQVCVTVQCNDELVGRGNTKLVVELLG